jgi:opacity protein-like surface antigen
MITRHRIYRLAIIFSLYTAKATAQSNIAFDFGVSFNRLHHETRNNISLSGKTGYVLNINLNQRINSCLYIEASPGLIQKNYSLENKSNIYQHIDNSYLHLPLGVKYELKTPKKLTISAVLGIYYAYWITSNITGIAPNVFNISTAADGNELIGVEHIKSTYKFDTKYDNRSEIGWLAKIGLEYRVKKDLSYSFNYHYYQSLTDQQKGNGLFQSKKHNQTTAISAGIIYKIN